MPLETCHQHNLFKNYICSKGQCNLLICPECFRMHAEIATHPQAVLLSLDSKEFFLRWTEYVLKKITSFSQVVTHMGYSKIFEMKLDANHPKGTVSQLNFQDIEKVAIQALEEHKKITEGNLMFIRGTSHVEEMLHPEFLKDLYNIVVEDARFNLDILLNNFGKKLIHSYPGKDIYGYAKFNIIGKELLQMQEERKKLVNQFESRILLSVAMKSENLANPTGLHAGSAKKQQVNLNQLTRNHSPRSSKDMQQLSQKNLLPQTSQMKKSQSRSSSSKQLSQNNNNNMSTLSNPSSTPKDINEITTKESLGGDKPSYEHLQVTISLLRSNEEMYQQKIVNLQSRVGFLRNQVERLAPLEKMVKQLEEEKLLMPLRPQERAAEAITQQVEIQLKKQVQQMQAIQLNLIQQNRKISLTLKDLQDIAQGRSRTISQLQQQITTMSQNISLKQRSIQQLNQLISNEQEQIAYRQNQVEILGQQIKKLLDKIAFLEKSIHELNNLVSNEQEQISYRENEVNNLGQQIHKLLNRIKDLENSVKSLNALIANEEDQLAYRENQAQILQKEVKKLLNKIAALEKSIRELNNLITNEELELSYRENQSEILTGQVAKLIQDKNQLQLQFNAEKQQNQLKQIKLQALIHKQTQFEQTFNELLLKTQQLQNKLRNSQQTNQTLKLQLTTTKNQGDKTLHNQLNKTLQKNKSLQTQLNGFITIVKGLQTQLNTSRQQVNGFIPIVKGLQTELNQQKQQNLVLSRQLNQTQSQINGFMTIVKGLETQLNERRQSQHVIQAQLNIQTSINNQLSQRLNSSSENKQFTEGSLHNLTQRNIILQEELKTTQERNSILLKEIQFMKEKYQVIQRDLKALQERNKANEVILKADTQKDQWSTEQISAIKSQLLTTKAQLNASNKYITNLTSRITQTNNQLISAHQQITRLSQQLRQKTKPQQINAQLLQQVVVLQADLRCKADDVGLLLQVTRAYLDKVGTYEYQTIVGKLQKLKTVNVQVK